MTATWDITLWQDDVEAIDVADYGAAQLLWQYRGDQPRLQGALQALLDEVENIQRASMEVLTERWPLTAIGDQLDVIGEIVGQPRGSFSDTIYRMFILARILVNRCNGRVEEIIDILTTVGVEEPIQIYDLGEAEFIVSITGFSQGRLLGSLIREAKGGGVTLRWVWSNESVDDTFQCSSTLGADDTDTDSGFGDIAYGQKTGGYLSGGRSY